MPPSVADTTSVSHSATAATSVHNNCPPSAVSSSDNRVLPDSSVSREGSDLQLLKQDLDNRVQKSSLIEKYKNLTKCKNQSCLKVGVKRLLHFHCLYCKSWNSKEFQRAATHMLSCESFTANNAACLPPTTGTDSSDSVPVSDSPPVSGTISNVPASSVSHDQNDDARSYDSLIECWDSKKSCVSRPSRQNTKHFHCKNCGTSHVSKARMIKHVAKCEARLVSAPLSAAKQSTTRKSSESLQAELICPKFSVWAVRNSRQGPAAPIHVICNKKGWECSASICQDSYNFHAGNLQPSFVCDHVQACIDKSSSSVPCDTHDLFNDQISVNSFSEADRAAISSFCSSARNLGTPVIKKFVPVMSNSSNTPRNLYYSVFAGTGDTKYYSRAGRVVVTFDRRKKTHKCECSVTSCLHKKISVLVSQSDPDVCQDRPEDNADDQEVRAANEMMDYVLEHKRIPFDMSAFYEPKVMNEFSPSETSCHKCKTDLVVANVNTRGTVFEMFKKTTGVKIITKKCPSCSMEYRYSDHKDGYFNYNNSSIFSVLFLEVGLRSWMKNTSLTSFLDIVSIASKFKYNIHLILNAIKAYLSLKEMGMTENFSCNRCGNHPIHLDYDVIRKVCFDVDPTDIEDHSYSSFSELVRDCNRHDLCRSYLNPKSPHFNSNVQSFSVRLSQSLPPFISPKNFGDLGPYTRAFVVNDRPEEICLPLERIEQFANTKNSSREIKALCRQFKIDTGGGKKFMIARLMDYEGNAEVYSIIRKKFTKITGKSGGILRAICPHGITYALKFLVLPESVADYTHVLSGFKVLPNFNFSDIASLLAKHSNAHYPAMFRPYMGRIDDPEDSLSDLYKDGRKKAIFDYSNYVTT